MSEAQDSNKGPFIIASAAMSTDGWPIYTFSGKPYVHRSINGATQEAQRLAKLHQRTFAIFGKWGEVMPVSEKQTLTICQDRLAATLVAYLALGSTVKAGDMFDLVERAIKESRV